MATTSPHDAYVELLLEKVRDDKYPSSDLMDRIEGALTGREQAGAYLEVLMEKVGESRYPSKQLLDRIQRVSARVS